MSHRWLLTLQDHSFPSLSVSPEDQAIKKKCGFGVLVWNCLMQIVKALFMCFGHPLIVHKGGKTAGFPLSLKMFASLKEAAANVGNLTSYKFVRMHRTCLLQLISIYHDNVAADV